MVEHPIIVIGAGIGGLSAAIRLATAGKQVIILEKNELIGGKMSQYKADGFRWDTGPSVITMRHVIEDLFRVSGKNMDEYLTLLPIDPLTRYFYQDGTVLDATSNLSLMVSQIEKFNPRDVEGYLAYLAYAARIHRITGNVFIYDKPPTPASFARVPIQDWLKADPLRTMQGAIRGFVKSPHLKQLLGRFATYVGGNPYEAPATLNVIAHVELTGGVWYPKGGIYQIAAALEKLAKEMGIEICTNQGVQQISVSNGRVSEVTTTDGTIYPAKTVISNVDVTTTYDQLLPREAINLAKLNRLKDYEPSCSGFVMMLGIEGTHQQLAHHNIFFSADYQHEFQQIFKLQTPADDPTIYIAITSKTDENHAPANHENWFILVNAPALSKQFDWEAGKTYYRNLVLDKLATRGTDIRDKIRSEKVLTPVDLQNMSGAWRGALYGPSANKKFTAFLRPHNRDRDIQGLYFAGGTTHPGGGVPMVILSGKVASDMVLEDSQ